MTSTSAINNLDTLFPQDSPLISCLLQRNPYEAMNLLSLDHQQQQQQLSMETQFAQCLQQHQQQSQQHNLINPQQAIPILPLTPLGASTLRSSCLDKSKNANQSIHQYFSPGQNNNNNNNNNLSQYKNLTPLMFSPRGLGLHSGGYSFDDPFDINLPSYSQRNTPLLSPHAHNLLRNSIFSQSAIPQQSAAAAAAAAHVQQQLQSQQQNTTAHEQSPQVSYDFYNNAFANDIFDDMGLQDWMDLGASENVAEINNEDHSGKGTIAPTLSHSSATKSFIKNEEENNDDDQEFDLVESYPLQKKLKTNNVYSSFMDTNSDDRDATTTAFSSSSCSNNNDQRTTTMNRYGSCSTTRPSKDKYASRLLNSGEKTLKNGFFVSPESSQNMCCTNTLTAPIRSKMLFSECPTPQKASTYKSSVLKQQSSMEEIEDFTSAHAQRVQQQMQQKNNKPGRNSTDEDEKASGSTGRNGLRILSKKVREIVCELKETTYKQVAESLIKDMESKKHSGSIEFAKDEQNVKRRVYDALNVLIAANVLSKEGKKVKAEPTASMKSNLTSSQNPLQKREYLSKALISKQERLEKKQGIIDDLIVKFVSLKSLCNRNSIAESQMTATKGTVLNSSSLKCLTLQQQQKKSTSVLPPARHHDNDTNHDVADNQEDDNKKTKLRFPFIGVYSPSNNSRISFKKFSHGLLVSSVQQLNIQGDIDILVKLFTSRPNSLYLHQVEKHKFLSPALLGFLREMDYFLQRGQFSSNSMLHHQVEDNEEEEYDENANTLQMEVTITNNKIIERKQVAPQTVSPTLAADRFYAHHANAHSQYLNINNNIINNGHLGISNELSLYNEFEHDYLN